MEGSAGYIGHYPEQNMNDSQQSGPAYPPQGVGSADP